MDTRTGEFYVIDDPTDHQRELAELRGLKAERQAAEAALTPVSPRFTKAYVNNPDRRKRRKLARMSKRVNRRSK